MANQTYDDSCWYENFRKGVPSAMKNAILTQISRFFTEDGGCDGNACNLYSEGAPFKPRMFTKQQMFTNK
jgi:hypothetical protein